MTQYTAKQRFPYPASGREYGNGGAHLEALAVAADAALDRVTANWTVARSPGRAFYKLASNFSVPVTANLTDFTPPIPTFTQLVASSGVGSHFPFSSGGVITVANYGWWDLSLHIETQAATTANAGTRRYFQAQKVNVGSAISDDNVIYVSEDVENTVADITSHELNIFVRIDSSTAGVFIGYQHGNTSSAVNILAAGTYLECLQVTGAVS